MLMGFFSLRRGHASENAKLPESLAASKNKIVFYWSPMLGYEISSTIIAQHAEVPSIP